MANQDENISLSDNDDEDDLYGYDEEFDEEEDIWQAQEEEAYDRAEAEWRAHREEVEAASRKSNKVVNRYRQVVSLIEECRLNDSTLEMRKKHGILLRKWGKLFQILKVDKRNKDDVNRLIEDASVVAAACKAYPVDSGSPTYSM